MLCAVCWQQAWESGSDTLLVKKGAAVYGMIFQAGSPMRPIIWASYAISSEAEGALCSQDVT